jgi:NAD(P)H-hydrate epimerase
MLAISRAQVREVDRMAIEDYSIPGIVLMENAGRNASEAIIANFDSVSEQDFVVVVGPGNNGGDGFVIARYLELTGARVRVVLAAPPNRFKGDSLTNFKIITQSGIEVLCLVGATEERWQVVLASATCVIDAILGTGGSGAIRGDSKNAIDSITERMKITPRPFIIAIDVPSGFDCDHGTSDGDCIRADTTLTFVASKQGFHTTDANQYIGKVQVIDIGVPQAMRAHCGL